MTCLRNDTNNTIETVSVGGIKIIIEPHKSIEVQPEVAEELMLRYGFLEDTIEAEVVEEVEVNIEEAKVSMGEELLNSATRIAEEIIIEPIEDKVLATEIKEPVEIKNPLEFNGKIYKTEGRKKAAMRMAKAREARKINNKK